MTQIKTPNTEKKVVLYCPDSGGVYVEILAHMIYKTLRGFESIEFNNLDQFRHYIKTKNPRGVFLCTMQVGFREVDSEVLKVLSEQERYCAGGFQVAKECRLTNTPYLIRSSADKSLLAKLSPYQPGEVFTQIGTSIEYMADKLIKKFGLEN